MKTKEMENIITSLQKLENICNNYINGNIGDFKKQIKLLSKLQLLDVIEHFRGYHGIKIHNIINNILRRYL